MRKIFVNKRGDVPVMILVVGVFVICTAALLSFSFFDSGSKKDLESVTVVELANSKMDNYYFYKEFSSFSDEEIADILDLDYDSDSGEYYINVSFGGETVLYYL